jgi:drug/metabolite transporter (DMT)-like permease
VNPAVAVFLGWLFADEQIGLRAGVAIAMILSAVVVVTLKDGRPNRAIQPASASSQRE